MKYLIILEIKFKTNMEKVQDILRDFGLKQTQNHCFCGNLNKVEFAELKSKINEIIKEKDSLIIFPLCNSCYMKKEAYGREINFEKEYYKIL